MEKQEIINFLKAFNQITVTNICKEEQVKTSNLYTMQVSKEKMNNIKNNIDNKIKKLYEEEHETDSL